MSNDVNRVTLEGEIQSVYRVEDVAEDEVGGSCAEVRITTREGKAEHPFLVVVVGDDAERILDSGEPGRTVVVVGALRPDYISALHIEFVSNTAEGTHERYQ